VLDPNSYRTSRARLEAGPEASKDVLGRKIRYLAEVEHLLLRTLLVMCAGWLERKQAYALRYVLEENRVLREQLGDGKPRLNNAQRRRLARAGKLLGRAQLRELATLAKPDTILGWYRRLIAQKYDGSKNRGPGRPRTRQDIVTLVLRMARDNPTWGYTRIRGGLRNLGLNIGRTTIARILAEHGVDPATMRPERWSTFLAAHWGAICGGDFFTVEVVTLHGLVRHHVLFVIDLATREVQIGGVVKEPYSGWVKNVLRGMLDCFDGFLVGKRHLILDSDPVFTPDVRGFLRHSGVEVARLPSRSPNLNAHAERFIGSVRRECLSRVVPIGEAHLRKLLKEYLEHYHRERNHQGIENRLIDPEVAANGDGPIRRRTRNGGLLSFYVREAA
jgi:transposase InsO family protein